MVTKQTDSLEQRRRLSGVKYTKLAQSTGISYKRLWRFFQDNGPLTRAEVALVDDALLKAAGECNVNPDQAAAQEESRS